MKGLKTDLLLMKWMVVGLYLIAVPSTWLLVLMANKLGALG